MTPYVIVLLAYLVGPSIIDEPIRFQSKNSFVSLQACQDEIKSDEFQKRREAFTAHLQAAARRAQALTIDIDDNVTAVSVTTTVSCEEDKRV